MSGLNDFDYDVFISYRWIEPDQSWVRAQLAPSLKKAGLRVFLDIKDFIPGRDLILEMNRAGSKSRHTICILSPDYFEGDRMVAFESLLVRRQNPSGNESRLIPLILRKTVLPEWIRGLVPVDWTDPKYCKEEWQKLLKVLGAKNFDVSIPATVKELNDITQKILPEKKIDDKGDKKKSKLRQLLSHLIDRDKISLPKTDSDNQTTHGIANIDKKIVTNFKQQKLPTHKLLAKFTKLVQQLFTIYELRDLIITMPNSQEIFDEAVRYRHEIAANHGKQLSYTLSSILKPFDVVRLMFERGLINDIFFDILLKKRPKYKTEIETLRRLYNMPSELADPEIGKNFIRFELPELGSQYREKKEIVSLLYFDLDDFTAINKRFGWDIGDEIIRTVGRIIEYNSWRHYSTRCGKDEFNVTIN